MYLINIDYINRTNTRTKQCVFDFVHRLRYKIIMQQKQLHPTQLKLLNLLKDNIDDPLTIRELKERIEASSTSVVAHHIQQLEKKGYLKRNPYNPKDYQILVDGPENPVSHLNVYGLASCGPDGTILDGDPVDRMPVASRLLSFPVIEAFIVKAKGKSMEPKIHDGDLVIARKTNFPEYGKVYVCVNEGEAMIKQVRQIGKGLILSSFNPNFEPFLSADDFRVEGEVKAIISRSI